MQEAEACYMVHLQSDSGGRLARRQPLRLHSAVIWAPPSLVYKILRRCGNPSMHGGRCLSQCFWFINIDVPIHLIKPSTGKLPFVLPLIILLLATVVISCHKRAPKVPAPVTKPQPAATEWPQNRSYAPGRNKPIDSRRSRISCRNFGYARF